MTAKAKSSHQAFIDFFCTEYKAATGLDYIVQGAKDGASAKALLKRVKKLPLAWAVKAMLADKKWGRPHASIASLLSQINDWLQLGTKLQCERDHAQKIEEEKRLAAENPFVPGIVEKRQDAVDADREVMERAWLNLHPHMRRQWIDKNRHEHGFGNEKSAMCQWWAEEGRDGVA